MNALSTIAAAVTAALSASTLSPAPASIRRAYVPPDYDTAADDQLRVLVVAFEEDVDLYGENSSREQCDHQYGVKVAILKRVAAADVTSEDALVELDRLSDFREQVIDFLKLKANRVMGDGQLDTLVNSPAAYNPATLQQKKTFVSVIALKYRLLR